MRQKGLIGLAVVLFMIGGALSLYRLLHRTDQELEMRVFEVSISLDEYPMPFSDPQAVRCPAALAEGESGTVHFRTTNRGSDSHTLALDYGTCHNNLESGETIQVDCAVQVDTAADDYVIVHLYPYDDTTSIYRPRTAVCSIPIVSVGSLTGQQALLATSLPGLLLMLAGALLWLAAGQVANRDLRVPTVTGALYLIVTLIATLAVALLTNVSLRGDALIALMAVAGFLAALLIVQLVAFGIGYARRPSAD